MTRRRPPRGPVALLATLGFALPCAHCLRVTGGIVPTVAARAPRFTLCASNTPRRRSLITKPAPPGALPESLASTADALDASTVYTGNATPRALSEREKKVVAYRQEYKCAACSCLLPPGYQVDHIKPLALGGTNGLTNLQALCTRCHTRKTRGQRHEMLNSRAAREAAASEAADPNAAVLDAENAAADDASLALDAVELSSLSLLRGMNQQQLAAVVCADGPLRLAAGPGTGKTRVLTARLAHLIVEASVPPQHLLAVTFTNKAARELRERITRLIGPDEADSITMGTFHSLCLSMLRQDIARLPEHLMYRSGFAVYDEHAALKLIKKISKKIEGGAATGAAEQTKDQKANEDFTAGRVQSIISAAKNDMYDASSFRANPPAKLRATMSASELRLVSAVFDGYQEALRAENIIDFDDMLLLTEMLLRTCERTRRKYARHWRHIACDEFQDTNSVQYQLLSLLGRDHGNVFVVGDVDQAIYGWRGANIRNQARLDSEFLIRPLPPAVPARPLPPAAYASVPALQQAIRAIPLPPLPSSGGGRRLNLELNYRSEQGILDMAQRLLAPAYAADPAAQLRLVTPSTHAEAFDGDSGARGGLARELERAQGCVSIVNLEDGLHEAQHIVDEILRLRDHAMSAAASGSKGGRGKGAAKLPSIAILYRTNTQSMAFERRLVREGVPYVLAAQRSFYQRKEIRDALAYLQLLRHNDTIALERVINVPPRKIGATTINALHAASDAWGVSLWRAVELYATHGADGANGANGTGDGDGDGDGVAAQLPKLRKDVGEGLRGFYELIMRFRGLVASATDERAAIEAAAAGGTVGGAAAEEEEVAVRLRMVSTEIRRRQRDPIGQDHEGASALAAPLDAAGDGGGDFDSARTSSRGLDALLKLLLVESGYEAMLEKGGDEESGRWRNLGELANLANERRVDELNDFLDQIALVSDVDALDEQGQRTSARQRGAVQLSTIHGAKGLEFDHVFVTGVEEDLLPHYYCTDGHDEVEEERRLLYVAMTRARKRLVLTHTDMRARWGKVTPVEPSRFLDDLPSELRTEVRRERGEWRSSSRTTRRRRSYGSPY